MAGRMIILFLFAYTFAGAAVTRDSTYTLINGEKVYKRVQFKPEFPGGLDSLMAFLDRNLLVPKGSRNATVTAVFIIDANGKIGSIRIENSSSDYYAQEATRVIARMPVWKPAIHLGKKVACYFTMPISFEVKTKK